MITHHRPVRLAALALASALILASCSTQTDIGTENNDAATTSTEETITLEIAAVLSPMTDVVNAAAEAIEDGYEIELVEVSDYVTANVIVKDGDIDGNFSQHEPYMEAFNAGNDASLVSVQPVYNFVIAFYSKTIDDIAELPSGGKVAIPDDASNRGRALNLLAEEGIITLDPEIDPYAATVGDIIENPKELDFLEVAISALNAAYEEADLVFQWPSQIAALGLTPEADGLLTELDDAFALQLVVREEDADSPATEALKKAFTSDAVRDVIDANETIEIAFQD